MPRIRAKGEILQFPRLFPLNELTISIMAYVIKNVGEMHDYPSALSCLSIQRAPCNSNMWAWACQPNEHATTILKCSKGSAPFFRNEAAASHCQLTKQQDGNLWVTLASTTVPSFAIEPKKRNKIGVTPTSTSTTAKLHRKNTHILSWTISPSSTFFQREKMGAKESANIRKIVQFAHSIAFVMTSKYVNKCAFVISCGLVLSISCVHDVNVEHFWAQHMKTHQLS